jgi:predicted permease
MRTFRIAVRTLTKTPFVTVVAVLSLALGIGANAAIYSLFDQMVMRSLPVADPDRLVNLANPGPKPGSQSCNQAGGCDEVFSYAMFKDLKAADTGFSGIAAHVAFGANLAFDGRTVSGSGVLVSGNYFEVLGVQPAAGRVLQVADDENFGENFVAVLSHEYWQNQLGADPRVLNSDIIVNGQALTVVGVTAAGFRGTTLGASPDIFVPMTMRAVLLGWFDEEQFSDRRSYWAYLFGRLEDGTTLEQAGAELNLVYANLINGVEADLQRGMSEATMERFRAKELAFAPGFRGQSSMHKEVETPLMLLTGITAVVLLIACANIANLLLARGAQRADEMAIRGSLGASRGRLLSQLLTESVLLASLGGAASLIVARWTLSGIGALLSEEANDAITVGLRPEIVLFAGGLALLTGLVFGLYPALHATRSDLAAVLRSNAGQPSGSRDAHRFRGALVVAQLALSTALLIAAGLFIKSLVNVTRVDLGLEADNLVQFSISPELNGYTVDETKALFDQARQELSTLPGVTAVSAGMVAILTGNNWGSDVNVEGFERGPDIDVNARLNIVGPAYFSTLGIPLISGREFTNDDNQTGPPVVIVNEAFAEKFGLDPRRAVGKRMSDGLAAGRGELNMEIVGVIENAAYADVKYVVPPMYFKPYMQDDYVGQNTFYLRAPRDPESVLRAVPGLMKRLDPNLPLDNLKTLEMQFRENVSLDRLVSALSSAFAVLATLLAAVGLYGVLAYTVTQRTREIGVRMALGADTRSVRGLVLRQLGLMGAVGCVIGLVAALSLSRTASSLLFRMEPTDPTVVLLAIVALAVVALLAGYIPARRASKIDPMQALRYE